MGSLDPEPNIYNYNLNEVHYIGAQSYRIIAPILNTYFYVGISGLERQLRRGAPNCGRCIFHVCTRCTRAYDTRVMCMICAGTIFLLRPSTHMMRNYGYMGTLRGVFLHWNL